MTEHILNFAIGIEDEQIVKNIQENAEKNICNDIKMEVMNRIFQAKYYGYDAVKTDKYSGEIKVSKDAELKSWVEDIVKKAIEEHKDEIIERSAELLADSYKRTKAYKERMAEEN